MPLYPSIQAADTFLDADPLRGAVKEMEELPCNLYLPNPFFYTHQQARHISRAFMKRQFPKKGTDPTPKSYVQCLGPTSLSQV